MCNVTWGAAGLPSLVIQVRRRTTCGDDTWTTLGDDTSPSFHHHRQPSWRDGLLAEAAAAAELTAAPSGRRSFAHPDADPAPQCSPCAIAMICFSRFVCFGSYSPCRWHGPWVRCLGPGLPWCLDAYASGGTSPRLECRDKNMHHKALASRCPAWADVGATRRKTTKTKL